MNLKEWRKKNKEHIKEYNKQYFRKWYAKNKKKHTAHNKEWRKNNRSKINAYISKYRQNELEKFKNRARAKIEYRIKTGKLVRQNCSVTGCTVIGQAHHPDYSKPLEIVWLCRKHHTELHNTK